MRRVYSDKVYADSTPLSAPKLQMKIIHFLAVPTDERFTVLADALASRPVIGVAAVYSNGLRVLLRDNITIAEFDRVAGEHLTLLRAIGRKPTWYELEIYAE